MTESRVKGTDADIAYLLSTNAIRERCAKVLGLAQNGGTAFSVHPDKLSRIAEFTAQVTRDNYPDLKIPFHSRWSHFQVGGTDRLTGLAKKLAALNPHERMKSRLDLVIVSVLLDAGAGPGWSFLEPGTDQRVHRSEGLAVASLQMFLRGDFSNDPKSPYRVDAEKLAQFPERLLREGFQVSDANPLAGFEGRLELLRSLGRVLSTNSEWFATGRPGDLGVKLVRDAKGSKVRAASLLTAIQRSLGAIWPGRVTLNGFNLGDVWSYAPLGTGLEALVPFHKLSQWLTYSIVDPILEAGVNIDGFEELTALAEYRNGGLLLDMGLIQLRDLKQASVAHVPSSPLVVEWRALTVALMQPLADSVRQIFGRTEAELPLGKVLEGGTWWAGRKIAAQKREGAAPPLKLASDGTVF